MRRIFHPDGPSAALLSKTTQSEVGEQLHLSATATTPAEGIDAMGELKQRGRVWWIRYYRDGKREEESSGSTKKKVAIDLLRSREGKIADGVPITAKISRFRFDDAAADLLNEYKVNGRRSLDELERRI